MSTETSPDSELFLRILELLGARGVSEISIGCAPNGTIMVSTRGSKPFASPCPPDPVAFAECLSVLRDPEGKEDQLERVEALEARAKKWGCDYDAARLKSALLCLQAYPA